MADPSANGAPRRGFGPTAPGQRCDRQRVPRPGAAATRNEVDDDVTPVATVVLADEHPVIRRGLRVVLDAQDGVEVVAGAGDVSATLRKVRGYKPSILVLDLNMLGGSSLEAIPRLRPAPGSSS